MEIFELTFSVNDYGYHGCACSINGDSGSYAFTGEYDDDEYEMIEDAKSDLCNMFDEEDNLETSDDDDTLIVSTRSGKRILELYDFDIICH